MTMRPNHPKIFVTGRFQADDMVRNFPHQLPVITLRSKRDPSLKDPSVAKLHLEVIVDDIETPLEGFTVPSRTEARAIMRAWKKCQGEKLVIFHCEAGVSRSAAAALGILFVQGQGPTAVSDAAQTLFQVHPFGNPNKRLLEALLETRYDPSQAKVISAQLIEAYSVMQKQKNRIDIPGQIF